MQQVVGFANSGDFGKRNWHLRVSFKAQPFLCYLEDKQREACRWLNFCLGASCCRGYHLAGSFQGMQRNPFRRLGASSPEVCPVRALQGKPLSSEESGMIARRHQNRYARLHSTSSKPALPSLPQWVGPKNIQTFHVPLQQSFQKVSTNSELREPAVSTFHRGFSFSPRGVDGFEVQRRGLHELGVQLQRLEARGSASAPRSARLKKTKNAPAYQLLQKRKKRLWQQKSWGWSKLDLSKKNKVKRSVRFCSCLKQKHVRSKNALEKRVSPYKTVFCRDACFVF